MVPLYHGNHLIGLPEGQAGITTPSRTRWGLGEALVGIQLRQSQENERSAGVLTNPLQQQKISTDLQSGTFPCSWQLYCLLECTRGVAVHSFSKFLSPECMILAAAGPGEHRLEQGWRCTGRSARSCPSGPYMLSLSSYLRIRSRVALFSYQHCSYPRLWNVPG